MATQPDLSRVRRHVIDAVHGLHGETDQIGGMLTGPDGIKVWLRDEGTARDVASYLKVRGYRVDPPVRDGGQYEINILRD